MLKGLEGQGPQMPKRRRGNTLEKWEVPASYGETVQRCRITSSDMLENAFEIYAAELIAKKGGYPD
jgi:hypothetical protein